MKSAPTYVLTATAQDENEDKDKQIAKLKAMVEEREKVAKKATEDKEENLKASMKAIVASLVATEGPIPVVRAKLQAEFDKEEDEAKKAIIKAALDVFDEGNGTQVNNKTQVGSEDKEEQLKAQIAKAIAPYENKLKQPIIAQILTANTAAGASAEQLEALKKSLTAKSLGEVETYFEENKALFARATQPTQDPLVANFESSIPFNGEFQNTPLVGNSISIDKTLQEVTI